MRPASSSSAVFMIAVDRLSDRLEMAREQGAEVVNFDEEDPVGTPATGAIEAYETFDQRKPGWIKVELLPEAS